MDDVTEQPESKCAVCGRGLLPGERPTHFVDDAGIDVLVCELCKPRAEASGWLDPTQAAVPGATTERSRRAQRGGALLGGLLGRRARLGLERRQASGDEDPELDASPDPSGRAKEASAAADPPSEPKPPPPEPERPHSPQPPRRPAMEGPSLSAAVAAFNNSDARRMVGGLNRSLGSPRASGLAVKLDDGSRGARVTVVWELAWYQWLIGPGRSGVVVQQKAQGDSVEELRAADRTWNLEVAGDGALAERSRAGGE